MRNLFYLGLVIILFTSCEKDDSPTINYSAEETDYLPLGIGNYWIYKHYDIDSLGNETERDIIDSVIINRDTIINNNQYFILEGTNYPFSGSAWGVKDILRDSSGYIVDEKGQIRFSVDNFSDTLDSKVGVFNDDTLYTLTYQMEIVTNPVTIPAGEFEVLNFKGTITTPQQIPGTKNPRFLDNLYSNNVGKVLETYFYLHSPIISEKRLIRYHIVKE